MKRVAAILLPAGLALACAAGALAAQYGMQEPASAMAAEQRWLHAFVMWVIVAIAVVVFGAMFYSIVAHRRSSGRQAAQFHESAAVEVAWTIVPAIIVIVLAIPATRVILAYKDTGAPDMTVKVTGYQWLWGYDYLDENVSFYSQLTTPPEAVGAPYYEGDGGDAPAEKGEFYLLEVDNEMVVPVGKKVRLLLTAADVIHAWWVPQLGVKQDAIPGIVRDAWFRADRPGVYRGQCAELCGKNHGFMPIVVRAVSEEEYEAWLAERGGGAAAVAAAEPRRVGEVAAAPAAPAPAEWNRETLMEYGETAYGTHCAACHQANGEGLPPAFPALKGAPTVVNNDPADHINIVLNGKAGTAMAAFHHLSDEDLAAIITYERNAWDGGAGDVVMPEDIGAAR